MALIDPEQLNLFKKKSKFGNKITKRGEITFHSKKEADRWDHLNNLLLIEHISNLRRQVKYRLEVNHIHICDYVADFVYVKDKSIIVEDIKGIGKKRVGQRRFSTRTADYRIKKKLMKAIFNIDIVEPTA